jgi:NAD(P)H-hydrate epimerase
MILGPGLGKSEEARNLVSLLLKNLSIPAIVDADGLNLSANTDLLQNYRGPLAITPHPGEAARLLRKELKEITENPLESCKLLSEKYGCTVLLKDAHTLILTEERLNINLSGNNGMATAGSGDVLSGIVGALLAQRLDVHDAACFGAFIHGLAGDHAAKKHGKRSVTASRVLENIEETLKHLA